MKDEIYAMKLQQALRELIAVLERLSAACDGPNLGTAKAPSWAVLCAAHSAIAKARGN